MEQTTNVKLKDFCGDFYIKNIINGSVHGIDVNKTYYDGFQALIAEVFPEFLKVDSDKLKEEFTVLRFELFALAWQHSFGENNSINQSVFTLHFLEKINKQDIWDKIQRYNSAIATAVRTYSFKSESETSRLYLMRANLADKFILVFEEKGINVKDGKEGSAIGRVINRIESNDSWNEGIIAYNLSFTLLRNLGFNDNIITKVLGEKEVLHRLISIIKGFYDGANESWENFEITNDDNKIIHKKKTNKLAEDSTKNVSAKGLASATLAYIIFIIIILIIGAIIF